VPPFLLAQLSDPHIGATWAGGGSVEGLAAAVSAVREQRPDAVVVTGDLADHASDEEYRQFHELLAPLDAPYYLVPGNHDDRRAFNDAGDPVQYSVDLGPLRLVVLDTTIPGDDAGALGPERLEWLDDELAAEPKQLTLVAMHHPPFLTGVPVWDAMGLATADREALGALIQRHRQIRRLVGGHFHRAVAGELAGCTALIAPSTYTQFELNFTSDGLEHSTDPPGFLLHAVVDGELISHLQPVRVAR